MTKANFMAARFGGTFEMWSPERLVIETVTKRLGGDSWMAVRSSRDERYDEVSNIITDTQEKIIDAFRSGALTSYVHNIDTGLFYVIPARVWDGDEMMGDDSMGYLDGRLYRGIFDDEYHRSIPGQFLDTAIMIVGDAALAWLKSATVAALPQTLKRSLSFADLDRWFVGLGDDRKAMKNADLVQAARDHFPEYHVARDRVLDLRRKTDGPRDAGRPINGE
jgi:hypothetical protein